MDDGNVIRVGRNSEAWKHGSDDRLLRGSGRFDSSFGHDFLLKGLHVEHDRLDIRARGDDAIRR